MEHSKNYEKVKNYYENFLKKESPMWSLEMTWTAVGKWITEEEYKEITGFTFPAQSLDEKPQPQSPADIVE